MGPLRSITFIRRTPQSPAPRENRTDVDANQVHNVVYEHVLVRGVCIPASWPQRDRGRRAVEVEHVGISHKRRSAQLVLLPRTVEGGCERGEKRVCRIYGASW